MTEKGEQLKLIEVGPENLDKIEPHARKYKAAMKQRMESLKIEVEQKQIIQRLAMEAQLTPLPNGHITFECLGLEIDIEPTDVVIHVKEIKPKKKRASKSKGGALRADEPKPDQGEPTAKERKRKKRTAVSMQKTVTETENNQ